MLITFSFIVFSSFCTRAFLSLSLQSLRLHFMSLPGFLLRMTHCNSCLLALHIDLLYDFTCAITNFMPPAKAHGRKPTVPDPDPIEAFQRV